MTPAGLLHSDIHGSRPTYGSPWLFAVCRVLLRLPVPRHSPCALCSLTMCSSSSLFLRNCSLFLPLKYFYLKLLKKLLFLALSASSLFGFQGASPSLKRLVGLSGLEPPTSRLSGVRSNLLSYKPAYFSVGVRFPLPTGGDERNRTDDPLLAKQVLSQLSYTPIGVKLSLL